MLSAEIESRVTSITTSVADLTNANANQLAGIRMEVVEVKQKIIKDYKSALNNYFLDSTMFDMALLTNCTDKSTVWLNKISEADSKVIAALALFRLLPPVEKEMFCTRIDGVNISDAEWFCGSVEETLHTPPKTPSCKRSNSLKEKLKIFLEKQKRKKAVCSKEKKRKWETPESLDLQSQNSFLTNSENDIVNISSESDIEPEPQLKRVLGRE